jgi:release factor glutamine methyltransferase
MAMLFEQVDMLKLGLRSAGVPETEVEEVEHIAGGDLARLRRLLERKRFGEPNAYLRGSVTRFGREFLIDRRTYIPDTCPELLIRVLIDELPFGASILEVGTGCGWIAITLACERPDLKIMACDIDPAALQLARSNAARHGVDIEYFESHFVDDVPIEPGYVVAVLPYGGDATDYSWRELEERPQMPAISIFDPEGPLAPQVGFARSVIRKGWHSRAFVETGYLSPARVKDALDGVVERFDTRTIEQYTYAIIDFG